jgi:hypothetical protein
MTDERIYLLRHSSFDRTQIVNLWRYITSAESFMKYTPYEKKYVNNLKRRGILFQITYGLSQGVPEKRCMVNGFQWTFFSSLGWAQYSVPTIKWNMYMQCNSIESETHKLGVIHVTGIVNCNKNDRFLNLQLLCLLFPINTIKEESMEYSSSVYAIWVFPKFEL